MSPFSFVLTTCLFGFLIAPVLSLEGGLRTTDLEETPYSRRHLDTSETIARINCGGSAYDDGLNLWSADSGFSGGKDWGNKRFAIEGTDDNPLFQRERYGDSFSYAIAVPSDGTYKVTLLFAEIFHEEPGKRIFNVFVEGNVPDSFLNIDLVAEVGPKNATEKSISQEVSDGVLNIDFVGVVDKAKVSAILVESMNGSASTPISGITEFKLIDVSSPDAEYTIEDGAVISLTDLGPDFNIVAETFGDDIDSVQFSLNGNDDFRTENVAPYMLCGDNSGVPYTCLSLDEGEHSVTATPYSNNGANGTAYDSMTVNFSIVAEGTTVLTQIKNIARINCGGSAYTDGDANLWSADNGSTGGKTYNSKGGEIKGTVDPFLFQSERFGDFGYAFAIPSAGLYKVTLLLAEIYHTKSGKRKFSVSIEDTFPDSLLDIDLVAEVGATNATEKTVLVKVEDGMLNIDFVAVIDNPKVSAIVVDGPYFEGPDPTAVTETEAPATASPQTEAPATASPQTEAPATAPPVISALTPTKAPTSLSPSTFMPSTEAPSTWGPTTWGPTTWGPSTWFPSTDVPIPNNLPTHETCSIPDTVLGPDGIQCVCKPGFMFLGPPYVDDVICIDKCFGPERVCESGQRCNLDADGNTVCVEIFCSPPDCGDNQSCVPSEDPLVGPSCLCDEGFEFDGSGVCVAI